MKSLSGSFMFLVGLVFTMGAMAQNPGKHIREGNEHFENEEFSKAETSYLKALETDTGYVAGRFNRADALYKQEKYQEAAQIFNSLTESGLTDKDQAAVWHNLGNSLVQGKQYGPAAEAYKNALRKVPSDHDTKYNLTYALEKLKEQQNQQKNQDNKDQNKDQKKDQEKKDNKNQDKKNKDKQKQDQNKDTQEQNNKDKQNQPQDKQKDQKEKQPQPRKISKNEARRMLEALKNNEKQTLKKLKRIKAKGQEVDVEKDW
jgi:tetratricopeptide (TPR) repeat protein